MSGADAAASEALPAPTLSAPAVQPAPPVDPAPPPPPPPPPLKRLKRPAPAAEDSPDFPGREELEDLETEVRSKTERAIARARDAVKDVGSKLQLQFESGKERLDRELSGLMSRRGAGPRSLVVPGASVDEKRLAESEEDLNIMGRILGKALLRPAGEEAEQVMGIRLTTSQDRSRSLQSVQVEGQGALFLFRVSFPLIPPSSGGVEPPRPARKASAWEEARTELYGRGAEKGRDVLILTEGESIPEFDEQKVAALKAELLESLRQASNMRHLNPTETVTILVQGPDANKGRLVTRTVHAGPDPFAADQRGPSKGAGKAEKPQKVVEDVVAFVQISPDAALARTTSLLIRVTKADIDAFAAGTLDSAAFTKRATILSYSSASGDSDPARKRVNF
ncbi:MAG: hypothetical protein JNN07_10565 [Verrucomicrobiales bacterium]|nr:hypothetical protein [Verrucomicrobiales bacterium]